jgi:nitrate/TMAO reductase-like tetraheme cytochrome c subunit
MRNFFAALSRSTLGMVGTALTTASAILIITLFALELVGFHGGPYLGILAYLILPGIFLLGLLLIPLGVWLQRRKEARTGVAESALPVIDFNRERVRRFALVVLVLTLINVVILAMATYKGVEVMESTEFCGTACHSVMAPEYTAYLGSPHARVGCVECHIGPGAPWFVKSKLSGAWQVVSVNLDLYPTPIPTPIHNLRPARETCEQCHWPTKFVGDRLKVIPHFEEDEANTATKTVLLIKVGGIAGRSSEGIHWHVDPGNEIRYLATPDRETIFTVELNQNGTSTVYDIDEEPPADAEWRVMDCVDCHNRPAHVFEPAERALDRALAEGRVDPSLPYVSREGLRLLTGEYTSADAAQTAITEGLGTFYSNEYPEVAAEREEAILRSGTELVELWGSNVFPGMEVTWGTYPNHIGHDASPGCFRCHDEEHATPEGETISQDCYTCHSLLAMEEEDPQILSDLNP